MSHVHAWVLPRSYDGAYNVVQQPNFGFRNGF
jgi:hypothetical protein